MFCQNCGKELKEDNLFCTQCGCPINNINLENQQTVIKKTRKNKVIIIISIVIVVLIGLYIYTSY